MAYPMTRSDLMHTIQFDRPTASAVAEIVHNEYGDRWLGGSDRRLRGRPSGRHDPNETDVSDLWDVRMLNVRSTRC